MFRELFEAASSKPSPAGIAPSPQSRAMYAVDLLLKWKTNKQGATHTGDMGDDMSNSGERS